MIQYDVWRGIGWHEMGWDDLLSLSVTIESQIKKSPFLFFSLLPFLQSDSLSSLGDTSGRSSSRTAHTALSPSTGGGEDSQSRLYGRSLQTPCKDLPGLQEDTDREREREREVQASHGKYWDALCSTVQYSTVQYRAFSLPPLPFVHYLSIPCLLLTSCSYSFLNQSTHSHLLWEMRGVHGWTGRWAPSWWGAWGANHPRYLMPMM